MIYIGNFLYLSGEEKADSSQRRHGEFCLVVDSQTTEEALDRFKEKIAKTRESGEFFEGRCSVFINQLLGVERFSRSQAMMFNFKSQVGDPILPFIGCAHPTSESDDCKVYEWEKSGLKIDEEKGALFMVFQSP